MWIICAIHVASSAQTMGMDWLTPHLQAIYATEVQTWRKKALTVASFLRVMDGAEWNTGKYFCKKKEGSSITNSTIIIRTDLIDTEQLFSHPCTDVCNKTHPKSKTWLVDFVWFIQQTLHTKKAGKGINKGLVKKK